MLEPEIIDVLDIAAQFWQKAQDYELGLLRKLVKPLPFQEVKEVLGECRGVVTVQCMMTPRGRIRAIEINPRFGGGAPLAIHAGADFPRWILMELMGEKPRINPNGFRDDIAMLRYDESVFVPNASKLH